MTDALPSISIVTPSYNQGQFISQAIEAVVGQGYPRLEYGIVDGGSTDHSVEVIRRYEDRLSFWVSEPDGGMYEAIQKGLDRTSGEVMAWINSDDKYLPWTLSVVGQIFACFSEVEWITTLYPQGMDENGTATVSRFGGGFNPRSFYRGSNLPNGRRYFRGWIMQEGTFWRRSLWDRAGARIDASLKLAGDFELWGRFFQHAELYSVGVSLALFRFHAAQKTATQLGQYLFEGESVLKRYRHSKPGPLASGARRIVHKAIGGRPLHRMPPAVARPLCSIGLLNPCRTIWWDSGKWSIHPDYVV